jgi:tRNA threonylcarbamoyladenosine modification (KEOPS) complex  Pcc1 subunit
MPEMPEPHDLSQVGRPLVLQEMRCYLHRRRLHAYDACWFALRARDEAQGTRASGVIPEPQISILSSLWCFVLENLGDFVFSIRFTIKDVRFVQSIPRLLDLELKNLDDSSRRIHDLQILNDGKANITIQVCAADLTGFKIAANSINRYIEIIGKVIELVQKEPSLPKSLRNSS